MQINPNDLLLQSRSLPVIVLADVSSSMEDEKIATLNDTRSHIHTAIIIFASNAQ